MLYAIRRLVPDIIVIVVEVITVGLVVTLRLGAGSRQPKAQ